MDNWSGWCKSQRKLDGVTAIVTGSNTGIGKETAKDFYKRGAKVIMACRDVKKAEAAKQDIEAAVTSNGALLVEELNLSSLQSVKDFAERVLKENPAISILVNNAGVMMAPEGKTDDGFETHIGVNHFAHALLTMLLLPRLKKSAPSRVIFVSSMVHQNYKLNLEDLHFKNTSYDPLRAYCQSKAANILFSKALAKKLKNHEINNVTTYSLHPGVINTEISRHFSNTYFLGATWIFNHVLSPFLKSTECGAQTTICCAVDEKCADESGLYYKDCHVAEPSAECTSEENAEYLWTKTMNELNLASSFDPFGDVDPIL